MRHEIKIKISGIQGSGKSRVYEVLGEALEAKGYNTRIFKPTPRAEDSMMASDEYHTIFIECIQERVVKDD